MTDKNIYIKLMAYAVFIVALVSVASYFDNPNSKISSITCTDGVSDIKVSDLRKTIQLGKTVICK